MLKRGNGSYKPPMLPATTISSHRERCFVMEYAATIRLGHRLLALAPLCGPLATPAAAASRGDPATCAFVAQCVTTSDLCVLWQVPMRQRASVLHSEAFEDAGSQVESLRQRRGVVHVLTLSTDASAYLTGLRRSTRLRTIFMRKGKVLKSDGLFLDDPTPVASFLDGETAVPPAGTLVRTVGRRPGACPVMQAR